MPAGLQRVAPVHDQQRPVERGATTRRMTDLGVTVSRVVVRRGATAGRALVAARRAVMEIRASGHGVTAIRTDVRRLATTGRLALARARPDPMARDRATGGRVATPSLGPTATMAGAAGLQHVAIREQLESKMASVRAGTTPHAPKRVIARVGDRVDVIECRHGVSSRRERRRRFARPRSRRRVVCASLASKRNLHRGNANSGSTTVHCDPLLERRLPAPSGPSRTSLSAAFRRRHAVASHPISLRP